LEIWTWEGAGADGGAELHVPQAPQEEDDDDPDKVEDEEASASEEGERRLRQVGEAYGEVRKPRCRRRHNRRFRG
jgi:hypothetical protein